MNADGSDAHRLTNNIEAANIDPAWSPDGERIAFVSRRHTDDIIYVINADGTNPTVLVNLPASYYRPTWSPDGKHIAFVSTPGYNLQVIDINGANLKNLGTGSPPLEWSPNSRQITFMGSGGLFVVGIDDSDSTLIGAISDDTEIGLAPVWSSSGDRITFILMPESRPEIYEKSKDGSGWMRITTLVQ